MRKNRILFGTLFCLAMLVVPVIRVFALTPTFLIGADTAGDMTPNAIDILNVYFANDASIFQFFLNLGASPITNKGQFYTIALDTMSGGADSFTGLPFDSYWSGSDFQLYYDKSGAYLYEWNASISTWVKTTIVITGDTQTMTDTVIFTGYLIDIGYPWSSQQDLGVIAATGVGRNKKDVGPDTGNYTIAFYDVSEVPWTTLPVFIPALVITVYVLYVWRFRGTFTEQVLLSRAISC